MCVSSFFKIESSFSTTEPSSIIQIKNNIEDPLILRSIENGTVASQNKTINNSENSELSDCLKRLYLKQWVP